MKNGLEIGTILTSASGNAYKVMKLLGEGGQGFVYEVDCNGQRYALKWYKGKTARKEQKAIIENLLQQPKPSEEFLWPLDLLTHGELFGYVMPLRSKRFKDIPALLKRKTEPSFKTLCQIGLNLVTAYRKLHARGYSYCDINFGNVFFDPDTGDVLICDNDNVTIDGMEQSQVMGTLGFMAPELVKANVYNTSEKPSTATDLFSLSVLLFYLFMMHHPLLGAKEDAIRCFDYNAQVKLYGMEPVFIFDPVDKSNKALRGVHDNAIIFWSLYPEYFKKLFVKAFTDGMINPNRRVQEVEWQRAFIQMLNNIMVCPDCGAENFYNEMKEKQMVNHICWGCDKALSIPVSIRIGKNKVLLNSDTKIMEHHLKDNYNMSKVVASVVQNPKNPNIWGLRNETNDVWVYVRPDNTQTTLPGGRSATIAKGCKIKFGQVEGCFE